MELKTGPINDFEFKIHRSELKHLKFEYLNNEYVAILIDEQEYEILKGYGNSQVEALNDLHSNLF